MTSSGQAWNHRSNLTGALRRRVLSLPFRAPRVYRPHLCIQRDWPVCHQGAVLHSGYRATQSLM